jgi:hypothetical protein
MEQRTPLAPHPLSLTLELVPDDEHDPDPAAVHEVGRTVIDELQQAGYTIIPLSTGQRGGLELIFQVVMTTAQTIGADIMAQKDAIDVTSALCAIFATISPLLLRLFHIQKKLPAHESEIKVFIKVNEAEMEVTSSDVADDERIIRLAERFIALHPTTKVAQNSAVKVRGHVPKRKPRQRR